MSIIDRNVGITADIPIEVFKVPKVNVLEKLLKSINEEFFSKEDLYTIDPLSITGPVLVSKMGIKDFLSSLWVTISEKRYQSDSVFVRSRDVEEYDILIRRLLKIYNHTKEINVFMIGDFKEVTKGIDAIPQILIPNTNLAWNAMVSDPYGEDYLTNNFPVYDTNLAMKKFISGEDGSGKLNRKNILWLSKNFKSELCIGALERDDYMIPINDFIPKLYNLCIAVIASTKPDGAAMLKMPIPNMPALQGIVGLFSLFFDSITILKLDKYSPDNNTVFISGNNFNPRVNNISTIIEILIKDDVRDKVLNIISLEAADLRSPISKVLSESIKEWVNIISNLWSIRSIN